MTKPNSTDRATNATARRIKGRVNLTRKAITKAERIKELERALRACRDAITNDNKLNANSIADTVWHSPIETIIDFVDKTLAPYCPFCKVRHVGADKCMGHYP